jgi:hypothetical protein
MHACPAQSVLDWQTPHCPPSTQPCPGWQSAGVEQEHEPFWQFAVAPEPHWLFAVQAPQIPATHAEPVSQPLFEVQAGVQMPDAHTSPDAQSLLAEHVHSNVVCVGVHWALGPHWLFVEQAPQAPATQTWPVVHCWFDVQPAQLAPLHATQAWYGSHPKGPPPAMQ